MKFTKKILATVTAMICALSMFTACGGDDYAGGDMDDNLAEYEAENQIPDIEPDQVLENVKAWATEAGFTLTESGYKEEYGAYVVAGADKGYGALMILADQDFVVQQINVTMKCEVKENPADTARNMEQILSSFRSDLESRGAKLSKTLQECFPVNSELFDKFVENPGEKYETPTKINYFAYYPDNDERFGAFVYIAGIDGTDPANVQYSK